MFCSPSPVQHNSLYPFSSRVQESTYGTHIHEKREEREARFCNTVHDIVNREGRCLIPVFALGRAQELLLILGENSSLENLIRPDVENINSRVALIGTLVHSWSYPISQSCDGIIFLFVSPILLFDVNTECMILCFLPLPLVWPIGLFAWTNRVRVLKRTVSAVLLWFLTFALSDEYWQNHPELHDIPIYYASSLAKKCMAVYQTYVNAMNDKIRKAININNPFVFKHISNLKVRVLMVSLGWNIRQCLFGLNCTSFTPRHVARLRLKRKRGEGDVRNVTEVVSVSNKMPSDTLNIKPKSSFKQYEQSRDVDCNVL